MIRLAESIASSYAHIAASRFHVERDDLAGAALLGFINGRPMRGAVIDELRALAGRPGQNLDLNRRSRGGKSTRVLCSQFTDGVEIGAPDAGYVTRLALERCGVLMLDCLPRRLRKLMLLRYWHDLTQRETAAEMKVSTGRISQLERKAAVIIARELRQRGIKSMRDVV